MDVNTVGLIGELKVQRLLNANKTRFGIKYISNLPIYTNYGYCQVDNMMVCHKGLFCIEAKNWHCQVECRDSNFWKTVYPTREVMVKSPIIQNKGHCHKIYEISGMMPENIVLFTDDATLKNPPFGVMYLSEFISYLTSLNDKLSAETVEAIYQALVQYKRSIEPQMLFDFIIKRAKI